MGSYRPSSSMLWSKLIRRYFNNNNPNNEWTRHSSRLSSSSSSLLLSAVGVAAVTTAAAIISASTNDQQCTAAAEAVESSSSSDKNRKKGHQHRRRVHGDDVETRKKDTTSSSSSSQQQQRLFQGQCLERQLYTPRIPYPAWDHDWDGRMTPATSPESLSTVKGLVASKTQGTIRHVILIRHGQYVESSSEDTERILTPLGRTQAHLTGRRLAVLAQGGVTGTLPSAFAGRCHINAIHVSGMTRAKETAQIIASYLPGVTLAPSDPLLNEALPAPMIPPRPDVPDAIQEIDQNHDRVERAFHKYIYRSTSTSSLQEDSSQRREPEKKEGAETKECDTDDSDATATTRPPLPPPKHEFELIVCHGNIIRYFFCRALQLPPEAWLRLATFNCSLTYLVVYPNGHVGARLMGDIGHLGYDESTFSRYHGFHW